MKQGFFARGHAPLSSRPKVAVAAVFAVAVAGCGSGSSNNDTSATMVAAVQVLGQATFAGFQANAGGAPSATTTGTPPTLSSPFGGPAGNGQIFYVPDSNNNRVIGYVTPPATATPAPNTVLDPVASFLIGQDSDTSNLAGIGPTSLSHPNKAWVSSIGQLVITDTFNNRVLIWNQLPTGNVQSDVVVGQPDWTTKTAGTSQTALSAPSSAIITEGGELIVADQSNSRVLIWVTVPQTNNKPADIVLGQPDFNSNLADNAGNGTNCVNTPLYAPSACNMNRPSDVWSDGNILMVADTSNSRVMVWAPIPLSTSQNFYNASYAVGQNNLSFSQAGQSGSTFLSLPSGVYNDGTYTYIADTSNNRVMVYQGVPAAGGSASGLGGTPAIGVLGQEDFTHITANDDNGQTYNPQDGKSETAPTSRTLSGPTGVFAINNLIYITDRGNNRALVFNAINFPAGKS